MLSLTVYDVSLEMKKKKKKFSHRQQFENGRNQTGWESEI